MHAPRNPVPRLDLRALDEEISGERNPSKRLVINVGGIRHETLFSTLERIPGTRLALLANLQEADETYEVSTGEYFFDRHPRVFEAVIQYYRTEELHMDKSACGNVLKGELAFWGIEENEIEPCCWADYSRYTEHKETLRDLDNNFSLADNSAWEGKDGSCSTVSMKIWRFLEEPSSSRLAKVYAVTSMLFVAMSIGIFVLETHPLFQVDRNTGIAMTKLLPDEDLTPTGSVYQCCCHDSVYNTTHLDPEAHPTLKILDYICVAFFTLEVIVRFTFCPDKIKFWKAPLNLIDVICLLPHYVSIALGQTVEGTGNIQSLMRIFMVLRIIRILRIFKLMKHYNAFKILVYTIKVSTKELLLMIVFLMSGVLMFASIIHYAEKDNFPNIPIAIWWALVTMTTVGYGDKYPVGYIGYAVGSVCVICGVLVIAFTVPIVVNNFSLYYSHAQTRIKIPKRKKRLKLRDIVKQEKANGKRKRFEPSRNSTRQYDTSLTSRNANFSRIPPETSRETSRSSVATVSGNPAVQSRRSDNHRNDQTQSSDRNIQRTGHGTGTRRSMRGTNKTTTVSPIEVSDIESCDSGYTETNQKKIEEETQRIMDNMVESDKRMEDEKRRQEKAIQKRRDKRTKTKEQTKDKGDEKY